MNSNGYVSNKMYFFELNKKFSVQNFVLGSILLVCICMASYMTYLQFKYYLNNDDIASISYQHFNQAQKDEYPTITLCFTDGDRDAKIFDENNTVFESNLVTPLLYQQFLNGWVRNHTFDFSTIQYDEVLLNIHDGYLIGAVSGTSFFAFSRYKKNYPFALNEAFYRSSDTFCFEKNVSYQKNLRQYWDGIYLNSTLLYQRKLSISLYVHEKGKLMRSVINTPLGLSPKDYENGLTRNYDINSIEVLRQRKDSNLACNDNLIDEDGYILKRVMTEAGCIPTYWEKFVDVVKLTLPLPKCRDLKQYRHFSYQFLTLLNKMDTVESLYTQPCTQMTLSVTIRDVEPEQGHLQLYVLYNQDVYKEIVNSKAYTTETLLGQIGGFVGMY